MTVVGAILTSLVVAREWERGTMEALLSTEITRAELLLCKLIPYYFLGMLAMLLCMLVSVFILACPIAARCRSCLSSLVCFCSAPWGWGC
ncbi:ABC transporter [Klebsiella pneumoniae subsp. ozaenae]|uniref:ABC transporter n=1 Tax=Klebsiella pneumoniae subsp. ozaenae TaxID=574 RepID=A0A377ZCX6_KLEPO|nr:ABC transporter [Klebsiella pneumoniae subsp. ozaenae]